MTAKQKRGLVLLFWIFAANFAQAITCPELEQLWRNQYVRSINARWNTNQFSCNGVNAVLALTFFDLQATRYRANYAGLTPNFYDIVIRNVRSYSLDPNCKPKTLAYTVDRDISFCPRFFTDIREDRNSTLVHETRHTQSDDPAHVTCSKGASEGTAGACDQKFYNGAWAGSGYNIDIYYLNWSFHTSNNDALARDMIQSSINALLPDRFNEITAQETSNWRR